MLILTLLAAQAAPQTPLSPNEFAMACIRSGGNYAWTSTNEGTHGPITVYRDNENGLTGYPAPVSISLYNETDTGIAATIHWLDHNGTERTESIRRPGTMTVVSRRVRYSLGGVSTPTGICVRIGEIVTTPPGPA
jgi:hypothetical protein